MRCLASAVRCAVLLAGDPFCGVEGLGCLAEGVVAGAGAEGGADAVAVELLAHRAVDAAVGEADVSLAEVLDDEGQDRVRGVVDVADGAPSRTIHRSGLPRAARAVTSSMRREALA